MSMDYISESNLSYLNMMKDIYEVSLACNTKTYIWGGFTVDILEGKFLREHGDLDGFVENMMALLDDLKSEYENKGYQVDFINDINMLTIRKGDQHAAFNPLDVNENVAMWRHIGDQGTVYFPYSWLDNAPREFYNTYVYTSGINFEYGFRKIVHLLNPEWKVREKDRVSLEYFQNKIIEKGINEKDILSCIWSFSPFWIKKRYSPFDKPTLVWPMYDRSQI
ncbi:nucleotidyltransferase domain-containing protein [Clostridium thermosuccinogenes]|uniref:nucleotidyltransferase domain-containing protein n=1 Tax=Clostridium thermosuccinogenes TaxID=84032 RepID=UPI000CCC7D18|nr:hypothetical protein [Pseudoclostridium thermosuccinogenes]PNT92819.1 hypothetical protein CDQ83_04470 [Pseudoclostridium thermosuccinogenes]